MNMESELPSNLDGELITKSLNFHGQLLQKQWEVERGEGELQKHDIGNLDYSIYTQRQRHLSFQDRGKRLKLHQFISKQADVLFNTSLVDKEVVTEQVTEPGHFAVLPPFETFLNLDKSSRSQHFFQCLSVGDVIVGSITNKTNSGLFLKVLCLNGDNARSVADLNIKAFCPTSNLISAVDKKNIPRTFMLNDLVSCEVLEVVPDAEKIMCGMKGVHASEHKCRLGLFFAEDFPEAYKLAQEGKNEPYEEMLEKSVGFHNPSNVTCLSRAMGLGNRHHTNLTGLKGRFPENEYATELRSQQAQLWASKNVADGVEHFKAGRITEAYQCLNKALSIDANNIEALVARGALHANKGNFKTGLEDFEKALKLNPTHVNGRKYMSETLVAYGRSFEELNQFDEARKSYERCLDITPYHEEALSSLEYIKHKLANGAGAGSLTDGLVSSLSLSKTQGVKDTLKQLLGGERELSTLGKEEAPASAKKKKKEKKAKKNKRHSSSSSSSSSSGSSSDSSDSSSSDTSSASSNDSHRKKKHKSRKSEAKEKSLSPLSKRMAVMDSGSSAIIDGQRGSYNPPAMPYSFSSEQAAPPGYPMPMKTDKESEYEQRVCKFLEQTKGDSDYEEKVRKFLDETAKWKKDRKAYEEKAKKKRKKEKKARSKSKKKKREDRKKKKLLKELEEKKLRDALRKQRRRSANVNDEDDEFLYGEKPDLRYSLPELEDLQNKLSYYVKAEKGSSKKKEKSSSVEKLVAAAQMKAKANSPKVLYLQEEEKEEARARKLAEKKKMDMFEESPPQIRIEAKNVPLPPVPPPSGNKFKMQIGGASASNRLKKRVEKSEEKETWNDEEEKRFIYVNESIPAKEAEKKIALDKKKEIEDIAKAPMIMDKLGGFRINPAAEKKNTESDRNQAPTPQKRKLRSRVSESDSSDSDVAAKKKERQARSPGSSRSRSRSRSHKKYSSESPPPKKYSSSSSRSPSYRKDRSRSKSGSYRSRSGRRYRSSESGSYRSRSRSRSRSMDYHRRSRSRSDDRHRYHKYPGRYPRNRGTYYRPRFQTGGFQKRPGFYPRNRGGQWRPGSRPFNRPFMRGRGRPRFFHNNYKPRDDRYRRYERDLSRSDDDDESPMRKVDAAKERIDRMLSEDKRHSGPLSEGEERDDDYIDRKDYERDRSNNRRSSSPDLDRSKKEGSKEKNSKPDPW